MSAPPPWLRHGRLALREFAPGDAAAIVRLHAHPEVRAHLVDDYPLHELDVAALFVERLGDFYARHPGLGIWHAGTAEPSAPFVGWFSLMPMVAHAGAIELGSRLLPEAWGSGLALDGGEALLQHAFTTLGAREVWGACAPANRGARLCLEALGFEATGLAPYDAGLALHHRVSAAAWRRHQTLPRRERLRHAARALRAAAPHGERNSLEPA